MSPYLIITYKAMLFFLQIAENVVYWKEFNKTKAFLKNLSDENKSKNFFVFANGPSLKDINFKKVNDNKYFFKIVVNSFVSKVRLEEFSPDMVVFADSVTLQSDRISDLRKSLSLNVPIIMPIYMRKHVIKLKIKSDNIYYVSGLNNLYSRNFSNPMKALGFYSMTAFYALVIAKLVSSNKVYFAGFDNSYFKTFNVTKNAEARLAHEHFYQETDTVASEHPLRKGKNSSLYFYDFYAHFRFLEMICNTEKISNVAKVTYLANVNIDNSLDIYND
ncbi:6-hydroxymethylpterin diphosphokinase MptE-like protein [Vibrio cincinnatiensis]